MNQLGFQHLILSYVWPILFCCGRLPFKKQEFDSCFILQTTPDILARHVQTVCLGVVLSLFRRSEKIFLSIVGRNTFYGCIKAKLPTHCKWNCNLLQNSEYTSFANQTTCNIRQMGSGDDFSAVIVFLLIKGAKSKDTHARPAKLRFFIHC